MSLGNDHLQDKNAYANALLESMSTMVNQSVIEAPFDTTIQATILECEDESAGKYKVKYQDSIFYAFADNLEKTYSKNAKVYILVPSSDFSKTKRIIGAVNNLNTDYVSVVAGTEGSYDKIGTDIILDSGEFGLISYYSNDINRNKITLYNASSQTNLVQVDDKVAKEYLSTSEYFIMAAKFRTDLAENQKGNGIYTYSITIEFKDSASGETKFRTFTLSSFDMSGQPNTFLEPTRQFKSYCYTGLEFVRVSTIEFYCENFPKNTEREDLFISELELYAAKPIPQEELTSYHITLITPEGSIFIKDTATKELPIEATFKIDGKAVDSSTLDFFWFIEDRTIGTESVRYNKHGGIGWRCLNDYKEIEDPISGSYEKQWTSKGVYRYIVTKDLLKVESSTIKCIVPYEDVDTQATQEMINRNCEYTVKIKPTGMEEGTPVINWYNDEGVIDLECITRSNGEEITTNLEYVWGKTDAYGNTVPISPDTELKDYEYWIDYVNKAEEYVANNPGVFVMSQYPYYNDFKEKIEAYKDKTRPDGRFLRNVMAKDIDTMATFSVTVVYTNQATKEQITIGTAKISITNGKSSGGYILNLEAPPLFKYDANGVAPTSDSLGSQKLILTPLSFVLLDSNGSALSDTAKLNTFDIVWTVPAVDTMIVIDQNSPNVSINDEETEYRIYNVTQLVYKISPLFYVNKNNNSVTLTLRKKDDDQVILQAVANFLFTKEGGLGTNGTDYNVTISLKSAKQNDITTRDDIPIVKLTNYKISPTLEPINFYTDSKNQWLKFMFWCNGEKIYESIDGSEGTKTTEGKDISNLKWELLSNSILEDDSYYTVSNKGEFGVRIGGGYFPLNPCNIVKVSFNYQGFKYSACMPIVTILVDETNYISAPQNGGFTEVTYQSNGIKPSYFISAPFEVKIDTLEGELGVIDYDWIIGGKEKKLSFDDNKYHKLNQKWAKPDNDYVTSAIDNAIICRIGKEEWFNDEEWIAEHIDTSTFTEKEYEVYKDNFLIEVNGIVEDPEKTEEAKAEEIEKLVQIYKDRIPFYFHVYNTVHIPIYMSINKYSFAAINDWDGNIYTINDEKDVLLVPQIGAGRKEDDNTFSGMLMGVIDVKKKQQNDVGLFGYNSGRRTFFLDGTTGKVELGIENSKIIIDPAPEYDGSPNAKISANYDATKKTGMLIDLIKPSIKYGNGMFEVDEEGHLRAVAAEISGKINADELNANGCFIGHFEIFTNALLMNATDQAKSDFYDSETHTWNFDIEIEDDNIQDSNGENENNNTGHVDEQTRYKRIRESADIYFGDYGLKIGDLGAKNENAYFQVTEKGVMSCAQAIIGATEVSADVLQTKKIEIIEGGSISYFNDEIFSIDKEGAVNCSVLNCRTLVYDELIPSSQEVNKKLLGTSLLLTNEGISYFGVDITEGIVSAIPFLGTSIKCNELDINNICKISSKGEITAKYLEVESLTTNKIDINDYTFSSKDEYSENGKEIGFAAMSKGRILAFKNEFFEEDLLMWPQIKGWIPYDLETNTRLSEEPYLELYSYYKLFLHSDYSIDIQTGGTGEIEFKHRGTSETLETEVIETYAKLGIEGLTLHGGDTFVSVLDGTYNIPYPPTGKFYDKIFSMDGFIFKSIYVSDPTKEQSIDLTSALGPFKPEEVSVQLTINLGIKGIVATVSEILEPDPEDETHMIRNFYINYNRIPTPEEFGGDAIQMHWTAFFLKK